MHNCVVCAAFPDHKGMHYTIHEFQALVLRGKAESAGEDSWTELPRCYSAEGNPILASVHWTDEPKAHSIAPGCWLCEKTEDFHTEALGAVVEAGDGDTAVDDLDNTQADDTTPTAAAGQPTEEDRPMADANSKGYLAWSSNGQQVDVRSLDNGQGGLDVADLKKALGRFEPPEGVLVTVTETLGHGDAWVSVAAPPGGQAQLLITTGMVIDHLVKARVYEQVLLTRDA